jgi:hypothetical protein
MIQFTSLSLEQKELLKKSGITEQHLKNAIPFMTVERWDSPFNKLNVMFYIDRFGDFTAAETRTSKIVNALYNSLDGKDKAAVMAYLMLSED